MKLIAIVIFLINVSMVYAMPEIHFHAKDGRVEEVKKLLDNDPNLINSTTKTGDTPLHLAIRTGRRTAVDVLLEYGANVTAVNNYGNTCLHVAAERNRPELVELMLLKGADISAKNMYGATPLHEAARTHSNEAIRAPLKAGANIKAKNNYGHTPMDKAMSSRRFYQTELSQDNTRDDLKKGILLYDTTIKILGHAEEDNAVEPPPSPQDQIAVDLKVVDSNQKPIAEFEVAVFEPESGISSWKKGKDGVISLRRGEPPYYHIDARSVHHIIVRACGCAPYILKIERLDKYVQRKISLTKGLSIDLVLITADGTSIPEALMPTIVFPEYEPRVWMSNQTYDGGYRHRSDYNMHSLFEKKPGHYVFNVSEQSSDVFILIDHPGFLRAFRAGPFTKEDLAGGRLKIRLPRPGTLEVVFGSPKDSVSALPYATCRIDVYWQDPESKSAGHPVAHIRADRPYLQMQPEYFAPGKYWVSCNTGPADRSVPFVQGQINPAFFRDMKEISLSPGQVEKIVFEYIPYDENGYKGDYNATVSILWPDGTSATGVPYALYYQDRHFGSALIQEGTIPDNGQIELTGLRGGPEAPYFMLQIEKGKLGRYFIQLLGDEKTRKLEYRTAPSEGNIAPIITLLDIFSGENVQLSDYRGKVVFIEFWATWCGPCQRPMAHLCKIQTKKGTDWDGKAALLAVSIDARKETLIKHIQNKGWLAVRHLWCHEGEPGHKSIGAQTYGITGVPTALLIDQKGKIVWRGHPHSFNVEVEIDKLLETK